MLPWIALAGCSPESGPSTLAQPALEGKNVLMLSIDTLRADHLSHMPFLSGLVAESRRAVDLQQCSNWTFGSVPCTLTGLDPVDAGWVPNIRPHERTPMPAHLDTLAEHLAAHGYETVLISPNSWLSAQWDTDQGYGIWRRGGGRTVEAIALGASLLTGGQPWFLHVHLIEPHAPYDPPEAYLGGVDDLPPVGWDLATPAMYDLLEGWGDIPPEEQEAVEAHLRLRYAGEAAWLDDQLATSFDALEADGLLDGTLVVLWTDHGEQFWERGHATHAWKLGREENDGLLAFWGAGVEPAAVEGPSHAIDLLPTTLDLLGLPIPAELPGRVLGTARANRLRFTSSTARAGTVMAVTRGDLKLVYAFDGTLELYDRATDPLELVDLYDPDHPEVDGLWSELRDRAEAMSALLPLEPPVWPRGP